VKYAPNISKSQQQFALYSAKVCVCEFVCELLLKLYINFIIMHDDCRAETETVVIHTS